MLDTNLKAQLKAYLEKVSQPIGDDTVDFLRHGAIEATQACLNMCHANTELRGDHGCRNGGVHVPVYDYPVRALLQQYRLDALHDAGSLHRMGIGADGKIHVRRGEPKIAKERVGKRVVIVLSGMHHDLRQAGHTASPMDRSEFRKIWTGTYNMKELHF